MNVIHRVTCVLSIMLSSIGCVEGALANSNNILEGCLEKIKVKRSNHNYIDVKTKTSKHLSQHFFGFNIEWVGFQTSHWNSEKNQINNDIIDILNDSFSGAVYRYPGGTVANYFDWEASVGDIERRPKKKAVDWKPPLITEFGFQEYLDFVNSVNGAPWIVTNLYGEYSREKRISNLAYKAGLWAKNIQSTNSNILRWELGNELDRGRYNWSADKYTARAKAVAENIRKYQPSANFVSLLRDYNVKGGKEPLFYNKKISNRLTLLNPEYALHQYYDGPPGGPTVINRLTYICKCIDAIKLSNTQNTKIWITEHARHPPGKFHSKEWKQNWPKTSNLQSAISVADYVIALSQIKEVEGAFIHSLSTLNGPWPLFHSAASNTVKPSLVYLSLRILRDSMLQEVLAIDTHSRNDSKYKEKYDIRSSVQTNKDRTKFSIWLVNRSKSKAEISLKLPQLSSRHLTAKITTLYNNDINSNNLHKDTYLLPTHYNTNLIFDEQGVTTITIPGYSISALKFNRLEKHL